MVIKRTKKRVVSKQVPSTTSIVCGTENPASLACVIYSLEGGETATTFTPGKWHEGHENIIHGGLSGAVLDEIMGRSNYICDEKTGEGEIPFMTGELTIKYMKPIPIGRKMWAFGRVDRVDGRKHYNSSELIDEQGEVYAKAVGIYISVSGLKDNNGACDDPNRIILPLDADDPEFL